MKTKEMIDVMQAYERGEQIEYRKRLCSCVEDWVLLKTDNPFWDWHIFEYRVKSKPKYMPYKDAKEFLNAQKEHGPYIRYGCTYEIPIRVTDASIYTTIIDSDNVFKSYGIDYKTLLTGYSWADRTPCGILEQ